MADLTSAGGPKDDAGQAGLGRIFRHRMFALIWAGALLSNIGNWMEDSAQNWAVVSALRHDPKQSAFMSEVLNCANFIPALTGLAGAENLRREIDGLPAERLEVVFHARFSYTEERQVT